MFCMNKIFMFILIMNTIIFYFMKTPLSSGLILLFQTILISVIMNIISMNYWYSYILFLVMIGGMLILFIYMVSLTSNQKFKFNKFFYFTLIFFLLMILIFKNFKFNFMTYNSMEMIKIELEQNFLLKMSMHKLYNIPTNFLMIMMINLLLIMLFIVVKITNINMGPLRKNF